MDFILTAPFAYRVLFMFLSVHFARYKYYISWKIGECSQILAGLGYDYASGKWNAVDNMDILAAEVSFFSTSQHIFVFEFAENSTENALNWSIIV